MKTVPATPPAASYRSGVALACAALPAALATGAALATSIERLGTDERLAPDAALVLRIEADTAAQSRDLRVFIGTLDATALVVRSSPNTLEARPTVAGWPVGAAEVVVWRIEDGKWTEAARLPFKVLAAVVGGVSDATWRPVIRRGAARQAAAPARRRVPGQRTHVGRGIVACGHGALITARIPARPAAGGRRRSMAASGNIPRPAPGSKRSIAGVRAHTHRGCGDRRDAAAPGLRRA